MSVLKKWLSAVQVSCSAALPMSIHLNCQHNANLMSTGVEFRVTEEYDEDSPFSRPPNWQPPNPKQDPPPAADEAVADQSSHSQESSQQSSHTGTSSDPSTADTTGNGLQPANGTHAPTDSTDPESESMSQHMSETKDQLQESARSGSIDSQASEPSVGRGQVISQETDTPDELPAKIEVSDHPDADQPVSTEHMDTVHQKPGVRRTLDGSGHAAPGRDARQQGLLPTQPQAGQGRTPQGDPSEDPEGSDQDRPWWETAVSSVSGAVSGVSDAVSGAADSVKGAVYAGYQAVSTAGQPDEQPGVSTCWLLHSFCCCA